jgi:hypothetical protein
MQLEPITLQEIETLGIEEFYAVYPDNGTLIKLSYSLNGELRYYCTTDFQWEPVKIYWKYLNFPNTDTQYFLLVG